ncbi:hypothetical protein CCYA_CCYA06G1852 [Cyanidiococcus yangmingshanensis]|nr:hypothetical protein CCYA_CCYA06G1852 [Cyanidiococcus yangmingshanensis]
MLLARDGEDDDDNDNNSCLWGFEPSLANQHWLQDVARRPRFRSYTSKGSRWCAHAPLWSLEQAPVAPSTTDGPPTTNRRGLAERVQAQLQPVIVKGKNTTLHESLVRRLLLEASAGAIAEALVEFLLYPLDTLKQTQQLPTAHRQLIHSRHALSSSLAWRSAPGQRWLDPVRAFQLAIRRAADGRGFRQLYAGVLSGVVGSLPTAALFAITYESMRRAIRHWRGRDRVEAADTTSGVDTSHWLFWESTTAAATANIVSSLIDTPAELIKQRVQSCLQPNIMTAMRHVWVHEGGFGALWTGYGSNLLRNLPFDALEFGTFEQMKRIAQRVRGRERLSEWELLLLGMSAGGLVGALTTPLDVVRTRMLVSGTRPGLPAASLWEAIQSLLVEGGAPALFRGMMPRATWEAASSGVFFMFFDSLKTCFGIQLDHCAQPR